MWWTIELDVQFVGPEAEIDIEDAADAYLAVLAAYPEIGGAVTSVNLETRVVGARFDIEAPDPRKAFEYASDVANRALRQIDVGETVLDRAEILRDVPYRGVASAGMVHV